MYPLSCHFLFFTATHLDPQSTFLFFLKNRHHNKVLTCEVHGDGANEQRYISICYNICPGVRAMQKYMAASVSLGGNSKSFTRGPRGSMSIGAAGTAGAKTENTPAKGWRGHVGRGWAGACLGGTHMLAP